MESAATVAQLMRQIERQPQYLVAVESSVGQITLGRLRELSNRLANALIGLGLEPGSRVAYVARNHPEYLVLEFALLKAGLAKVPLNYRLRPAELLRCMEIADVRLVLADLESASALDEVLGGRDAPQKIVLGERAGWWSFEGLLANAATSDPKVIVQPDDYYHIRFSSGSTGAPKGIAVSQRAARAAILGNTWIMSMSAPVLGPRTLQAAPLVYAGGWSVLPTLLRGGTNVVLARFDADEALRTIHDQAIDWMFAVPTMLRRMAESESLPLLRSSRIGCLMLAGEPAALPAITVVSKYTDALVQCWGQTEAPASTTILTREEMRSPALWSSIGRPIPGVEFSVLVDGQVLDRPEPDQTGELVIRSATITSELLGAEAEHASRLLEDGWWRTSDIGHFDDEGRIFIVGRASETIITGGTNIQPVEIERALEEHPAVHEAVVVGVPDERWGETPAALVFAPELAADRAGVIVQWAASRLAGFKRPRHVYVTSQPLPRLSGESKIARGQLKATLAEWTRQPELVPEHVTKGVETRA
jgi:acyl-CoA synthetase (AMP-forming)/AMP-acid ligase II